MVDGATPAGVDPDRLRLDAYPFTVEVPTRVFDLDPQGHVGNIAVAIIHLEARTVVQSRLFAAVGPAPPDRRVLVAHVGIDYLAEARYPSPVMVGVAVARVGRTSFEFASGAFQEGTCTSLCRYVAVHADATGPVTLPDAFRREAVRHLLRSESAAS